MSSSLLSLVSLLYLFSSQAFAVPSVFQCKSLPGDPHWPSSTEWQALNSSVSGRLIESVPRGAVCHPSWPQFNNATCQQLSEQWSSTSFHYNDLESVDYNDETCLPDADAPCSDAGYPAFVVETRSVRDVQEAVRFARSTGVRVVIKGTGHDFPGR